MNKVVQFDKPFEDTVTFVFGNTASRVLAVDVKSVLHDVVPHLDISLLGILDGVGDEVGYHLLYAGAVHDGRQRRVGVFFEEDDVGIVHALFQ